MIDSRRNSALVRYGAVPEVARFDSAAEGMCVRGQSVVVRTPRGEELGLVLEDVSDNSAASSTGELLRPATDADAQLHRTLQQEAREAFGVWEERIRDWKIDVQLIDLEWTLDRERLILYVLNERGPECTKLAIQAAAAGFGIIDVQPVGADGVAPLSGGGGCGSCGTTDH